MACRRCGSIRSVARIRSMVALVCLRIPTCSAPMATPTAACRSRTTTPSSMPTATRASRSSRWWRGSISPPASVDLFEPGCAFRLAQNHLVVRWTSISEKRSSMNRRERRAAESAKKSKAAAADTKNPEALCEAGFRHLEAERYLDAQVCCQRALEADPNYADALNLMALLSLQSGQHELAAEWASRAIIQSANPQYFLTLGTIRRRQGQLEEALKAFDRAVQLQPDRGECWRNFGIVLVDLNLLEQAVLSFQYALKHDSKDVEAAERCGCALFQLGKAEEALAYLGLAEQLQPNSAEASHVRALALYSLKRFEDAAAAIQKAHTLDPSNPDINNNLGVFLQRLGREAEALPYFNRAISLRPNLLAAYTNKAHALGHLHRFDEAVAVYDALLAVDPGNADAGWSRSLVHLLTGNFEAGWAGREARWRASGLSVTRVTSPKPLWLGKDLVEGKTVLVHADEGLGDAIHFARYVPMLAARGARVILVVPDVLCSLLSKLPGVS